MNVSLKRAAAAGVLCLGLVAAGASSAQDRPAGQGAPDRAARMAEHQKMFEQMRQRREQRLHDLLQIKPDQEGAFKAYLAAITPQRKDGAEHPPGPGATPLTTPERLDRISQRLARMQQMITATRTFYGALTPDQRKAFDALPHKGFGGRGGHHGFGGHGREGFGHPPFEGPPPR